MANENKSTVPPIVPPQGGSGNVKAAAKAKAPVEAVGVKGFTLPSTIDLADFVSIYTAIRDRDFLSAAKKAVLILNGYLNPSKPTGLLASRAQEVLEGDRLKSFDMACDGLESLCSELQGEIDGDETKDELPPTYAKANGQQTDMSISDVIQIVDVVLSLIKKFRERRNS